MMKKTIYAGVLLSLSLASLTELFAQPTISSFTPASGPVGTSVTISGTNFDATPANNIVYFGPVQAVVTAATTTSLTVTVPAGADYRFITVTNMVTNTIAYSQYPYNLTCGCSGGLTFDPAVSATVGPFTVYRIQTMDIDGDGRPDLLTPDYTGSAAGMVITRNTSTPGVISFAPKTTFATLATQPCSVTPGDFDRDGKPDIVEGGNGGGLSVYRNTSVPGTISFAAKVDYTTPGQDQGIMVNDFDRDGKPDIVSTNWSGNTVNILRNTSTGPGVISFAAGVTFGVGAQPWACEVGDVDGDGKPDIVASNFIGNSISVLRNTSAGAGSIAFAPKVDYAAGTVPAFVHIGDLDGDGKPEIAVTIRDVAEILVYRNLCTPGTISFAAGQAFALPAGTMTHYGVGFGDLDGDGKPDLAAGNYTLNKTSYFINTSTPGTISFAARVDLLPGGVSYDIVIDDIDLDGRPDIVTQNTSSLVYIFRNSCATLPSELISYTGEPRGEDVILNWSTATETANDFFMIERSADDLNFEYLASVKAAGNSDVKNFYSFTDENPYFGINYYRLQALGYDGNTAYSKVISVTTGLSDLTLEAYPNPVNTFLSCGVSMAEKGTVTISVFNNLGQEVLAEEVILSKGNNIRRVDINSLSGGVYFLRINTGTRQSQVKFVKQ